jgi:hypothetical protein
MSRVVDIQWVIDQTQQREEANRLLQDRVLPICLKQSSGPLATGTKLDVENALWLTATLVRFIIFEMSSPVFDLIAVCDDCGELATCCLGVDRFCCARHSSTKGRQCSLTGAGGFGCSDDLLMYSYRGHVCCQRHASWARATTKAYGQYLGDSYSWSIECDPFQYDSNLAFFALRLCKDEDDTHSRDSVSPSECRAPRTKKIKL